MVNGQPRHVISYMKDFLFASEQARTPLGKLSGGERGRLMLAQALAKPSNLLVLDEPTNDLDMETLDVLEDMLADYPGTVLLISHDRDFLDRLVSGVIVPEGDGRWIEYAGGYSDMLAQRGADLTRADWSARRRSPPGKPRRKPLAPRRPGRGQNARCLSRINTRWKRCRRPSPRCRRKPRNCRPSSPIRIYTRATAPASKAQRRTRRTAAEDRRRRRAMAGA